MFLELKHLTMNFKTKYASAETNVSEHNLTGISLMISCFLLGCISYPQVVEATGITGFLQPTQKTVY